MLKIKCNTMDWVGVQPLHENKKVSNSEIIHLKIDHFSLTGEKENLIIWN